MRHAVLILAILMAIPSGIVGGLWLSNDGPDKAAIQTNRAKITEAAKQLQAVQKQAEGQKALTEFNELQVKIYNRGKVWPFLFGAVFLALFAGVVAELRRGFSAALLLFAAAVGPFIVFPDCAMSITGTPLLLPALLALFVRKPKPGEPARKPRDRREEEDDLDERPRRGADRDDREDEEEDRQKRRPARGRDDREDDEDRKDPDELRERRPERGARRPSKDD